MDIPGHVPINDIQWTPSKVAISGFCSKKLLNALKLMKKQFSYLLLLRYGSKYLESWQKKNINNGQIFILSQNMRKVLKRMQDQFSDSYDFKFLRRSKFCTHNSWWIGYWRLRLWLWWPDSQTLTSDTR